MEEGILFGIYFVRIGDFYHLKGICLLFGWNQRMKLLHFWSFYIAKSSDSLFLVNWGLGSLQNIRSTPHN